MNKITLENIKLERLLVSVIIPVRDDPRIELLLKSLKKQTIDENLYETIVIENGSSKFKEMCKEFNVIYFNDSWANTANARNLGLQHSKSDFILFTDSDCTVSDTWIENLLKYINNNPDIDVVGGSIERFYPKTIVQKYGSNLVNGQKELNYLPILNLPYVVCANALFRRESLLSIGGFDTSLISGNDVDICYKLGLIGKKIKICQNAVVYHDNRSSFVKHFFRFYNYAIYQVGLFKKFRVHSEKKILFNTYSYKCIYFGSIKIIQSIYFKKQKRAEYFWEGILLIVEGLGVFFGDVAGSIKFKLIYL
jgi:GT2 family glycosyltransferase